MLLDLDIDDLFACIGNFKDLADKLDEAIILLNEEEDEDGKPGTRPSIGKFVIVPD